MLQNCRICCRRAVQRPLLAKEPRPLRQLSNYKMACVSLWLLPLTQRLGDRVVIFPKLAKGLLPGHKEAVASVALLVPAGAKTLLYSA